MKQLGVSCFLLFLIVIFIVASSLLIPAAQGQNTARLAPSDDSWVEYEYPNTNHGLETVLRVKSDSRIRRSYLKFDLSSIPAGKVITSVKLYLYCTAMDSNPSTTINAHETGDSWSQSSITWNNAPTVGTLIANATVGGTGQYYSWDITSYGGAHYQGDKILSVVVKFPFDNPIQNNPNYARDFASKEYIGTSQDPYLEVTYDNSPPDAYFTYSPTYPVANDTVTFNASSSYDPDGYITSYMWDFGDGNTTTAPNPIITHVYSTYANYTVTLTVTDNDGLTDSYLSVVEVVDPAILRVSLPEGTYVKQHTGDPWIDEGWLLNQIGNSWSFTLKIYDTSKCLKSYDTHLIVALNDAAYNNLQSLTINGTSITAFTKGRPRPYDTRYWPNCVYPTWFNDTYKNIGLILPKGSKTLTVSATFSDATNARMHFDAYGSVFSCKPWAWCEVTWSPHSEDSTVMFSAPVEQYYLTVKTDPAGIAMIPGQGWYAKSTNVVLTAPSVVPNSTGVQYRFNYWDVDGASQGIYFNPITVHMDANHTATAHYVVQYQLTFTQTGLSSDATGTVVTVDGEPHTYDNLPLTMWVDTGGNVTYFYDSTVLSSVSGKRFALMSVIGPASPITVTSPVTVTGNYKTQYQITVTASPSGAIGGTFKVTYTQCGTTYTNVQKTTTWTEWVDASTTVTVSEPQDIINVSPDTRYKFDHYNPSASVTMDKARTITLIYKTQYKVTVTATPSGALGGTFKVTYTSCGITYTNVGKATEWTEWVDKDSTIAVSDPQQFVPSEAGVGGVRYRFDSYSPSATVTMSEPKTIILVYKTQYRLIMSTNFGTTNPSVGEHWYDEGSVVPISATAPSVIEGERYVWLGWTGTGTISYTGMDNPASVTMNSPITQTAAWRHEYRLIMATNFGTTTPSVGDHWYEAGSIVAISATPPSAIAGERYVWNGWAGTGTISYTGMDISASVTMNSPITETASWIRQFLLTIKTNGLPSAYPTKVYLGGLQVGTASDTAPYTKWFDSGASTGIIGVDSTVSGAAGTQYVFVKWVEDSSTSNPRAAETMNSPKTFTAQYKTQYHLTVKTSPSGIVTIPGEGWYDASVSVSLTAPSVTGYNFVEWDVDGVSQGTGVTTISVIMNSPHTATAHYTPISPPPAVPVGGRTVSLALTAEQIPISQSAAYVLLIVFLGATLSLAKRKRK